MVRRMTFPTIPVSVEVTAKVCTDAPVKLDEGFAVRLWKLGHYTPFEHNTMLLPVSDPASRVFIRWVTETDVLGFYNPAFRIAKSGEVIGSLRAFAEALGIGYEEALERLEIYFGDDARITYYVETNIGVAREILRHRCLSFTERSTRYTKSHSPAFTDPSMTPLFKAVTTIDHLKANGYKNDYTRELLPLGTATAFYMTGWQEQFEGMVKLRSATAAHEGARAVANGVKEDLAAKAVLL